MGRSSTSRLGSRGGARIRLGGGACCRFTISFGCAGRGAGLEVLLLESVSTLLMDKANRGERDRLAYVRLRASSTRLFMGFRIGTSLFHMSKLMEAAVLMRGD